MGLRKSNGYNSSQILRKGAFLNVTYGEILTIECAANHRLLSIPAVSTVAGDVEVLHCSSRGFRITCNDQGVFEYLDNFSSSIGPGCLTCAVIECDVDLNSTNGLKSPLTGKVIIYIDMILLSNLAIHEHHNDT